MQSLDNRIQVLVKDQFRINYLEFNEENANSC